MHLEPALLVPAAQRAVVLGQRCGGLLPATGAGGAALWHWIGLHDDITEGTMQWVSGAGTAYYATVAGAVASSAISSTSASWIWRFIRFTQRRSGSPPSPCRVEYSTSRIGSMVA